MYQSLSIIFILTFVGSSLQLTSEFIPKSFYVIHSSGEQTPTIYLREKRSLEEPLYPLKIQMKRSTGGGSGSGSYSSSSSYSGAGAGTGYNDGAYYPQTFAKGFEEAAKLAGFPGGFPSGFGPSGGLPSPNLHSRFGDDGGYEYSGSAQGAKGVYSASSSSIDGDGNVKYSVKTGKF